MSRLLWVFGWVGVAIWSLFAFAAYGLLDVAGGAAMRNADMFSTDPETVEWLFRLFSWTRGVSTSVVLVVWGVVSLAILSVPWIFDRLVANARPVEAAPPYAPPRDGVIDLAPGDYTVGPASGGRGPAASSSGRPPAVPRILPNR